jgi:hypothetical protein
MATRWLTVGEDRLTIQHVPADRVGERFEQRRRLADPFGQGRAVEIDAVALEGEPMERQWSERHWRTLCR